MAGQAVDRIPAAYGKTFAADLTPQELIQHVRADVEAAVAEAEWQQVPSVVVVAEAAPHVAIAPGL